jgi:hypothetical protein
MKYLIRIICLLHILVCVEYLYAQDEGTHNTEVNVLS